MTKHGQNNFRIIKELTVTKLLYYCLIIGVLIHLN